MRVKTGDYVYLENLEVTVRVLDSFSAIIIEEQIEEGIARLATQQEIDDFYKLTR